MTTVVKAAGAASLVASNLVRKRRGNHQLRAARLCYGHLAGRLGVGIADLPCASGRIVIGEGVCEVTAEGESFFAELGIDVRAQARQRRALCRSCLDVTERRPHIGGAVGAALAQRLLEQKLPQPIDDSRGLAVTAAGRWRLRKIFGPGLFAD